MSKRAKIQVRVGFEVGTGEPVDIQLAHIFVTGQTQVSGKTTTLQAIVSRSGCRALAFVTKRGEELDGRRIRPYLPREGDEQIHWRFVETIMASALGQRALKYERLQIINAAKDAYSLADVRQNISRLMAKAKGPAADIYTLLGEYLDLVLPEMKALGATSELDLQPGLNVMDLTVASAEMQALAIGAALQRINDAEQGVLVVFPEAWQFAPRDRNTAAKFQAEKMARMGAGIGNFLLIDSQDIAGVSPVLRQASTVWLVGVQREENERKRAANVIKASGVAAPKPSDIATLNIGQFFVCHGSRAIKTYVRPAWMSDDEARAAATGDGIVALTPPRTEKPPAVSERSKDFSSPESGEATAPIPPIEDDMPDAELHRKIDDLFEVVRRGMQPPAQPSTAQPAVGDEESLFQRFRERLLKDPTVLSVLAAQPEIRVTMEKSTLQIDGNSVPGRIARLIHRGYLDEPRGNSEIVNELGRTGGKTIAPRVSEALAKLKDLGFVTDEGNGWQAVKAMKRSIVEAQS